MTETAPLFPKDIALRHAHWSRHRDVGDMEGIANAWRQLHLIVQAGANAAAIADTASRLYALTGHYGRCAAVLAMQAAQEDQLDPSRFKPTLIGATSDYVKHTRRSARAVEASVPAGHAPVDTLERLRQITATVQHKLEAGWDSEMTRSSPAPAPSS